MAPIFLILVANLLLNTTSLPDPPQPSSSPDSSQPGCTDELVALAPCFGYVSAAPNNMTDTATSQCCEAFLKAFNSRDGNCFCYLMRQPLIFGFPLNKSRLLSLPTICDSANGRSTAMDKGSVQSICSESPALPPLHSSTGTQISKPPGFAPRNGSFSSASWTTPDKPTNRSSTAVKHIGNSYSWLLRVLLTSLVIFFLQ